MTELELRQMIKVIQTPLLVMDQAGTVVAENQSWASVRKTLNNQEQPFLKDLLQKVLESGSAQGGRIPGAAFRGGYPPDGCGAVAVYFRRVSGPSVHPVLPEKIHGCASHDPFPDPFFLRSHTFHRSCE